MADETSVKSGEEGGEQIEFVVSEDRIFIKGLWKGRTSKSKKGNMNMSWHRRVLFDDAVNAYLKVKNRLVENKPQKQTETDYEEIPF